MANRNWVESSARTVASETLHDNPNMIALVEELRTSLPKELAVQAAKFEDWVLDAAMDELKSAVETIDSVALANALLSNKALQGKLAVPLNDIAMGFSERLKADIKEQIHAETQSIHNLLAARKVKDKADRLAMAKKRDELKFERDIAIAKGELLWLRITALPVAGPALAVCVLIGVLIGINYPLNVQCYKGDLICGFRMGAWVEK
ncbi:MAG: hypothetical protein WCD18_06785 [Thermosynechococcaceae cyanobacterium]